MRISTLCFPIIERPLPQVLLGYKKRGFGAGKFAGFGGKVEPGESITQTAMRELAEEAGLYVTVEQLQPAGQVTFVFPSKPAWSQVVHLFLARQWQGEPTESAEMRPQWFLLDHLPYAQMWQDAPHWLPQLLRGEAVFLRFVFAADLATVCAVQSIHRD